MSRKTWKWAGWETAEITMHDGPAAGVYRVASTSILSPRDIQGVSAIYLGYGGQPYGPVYARIDDLADLVDAARARLAAQDERLAGIKEITDARYALSSARAQTQRELASDCPDASRMPATEPLAARLAELRAAHPVAAAYETAQDWWRSAHDVRATAGHQAMLAIASGDDPAEALRIMDETWSAYCAREATS